MMYNMHNRVSELCSFYNLYKRFYRSLIKMESTSIMLQTESVQVFAVKRKSTLVQCMITQ